MEGGLQIWDPGLQNLAMGEKIIWQLFVDKKTYGKHIFLDKISKGRFIEKLKSIKSLSRYNNMEFL